MWPTYLSITLCTCVRVLVRVCAHACVRTSSHEHTRRQRARFQLAHLTQDIVQSQPLFRRLAPPSDCLVSTWPISSPRLKGSLLGLLGFLKKKKKDTRNLASSSAGYYHTYTPKRPSLRTTLPECGSQRDQWQSSWTLPPSKDVTPKTPTPMLRVHDLHFFKSIKLFGATCGQTHSVTQCLKISWDASNFLLLDI